MIKPILWVQVEIKMYEILKFSKESIESIFTIWDEGVIMDAEVMSDGKILLSTHEGIYLCENDSSINLSDKYGGNIYIQEANNFNPFNFSFDYQVYDADGMASNTAAVRVISTATTTDDTRTASGGGSMGMFGVFGVFGLLAYRRWKK